MSESKNLEDVPSKEPINVLDSNIAAPDSEVATVASSIKSIKNTTSSERQIKFERAQRCLENAALVSKKIKEHRKATAELLGRPFEDDLPDAEMASTVSERTGYSAATDHSTTLSVEAALSIPGISESLANTLKQKEILMEKIKQYKEISKRQVKPISSSITKESSSISHSTKSLDNTEIIKLTNTIKEKENTLSVMQVKIKAMETTILDLQEKINEKDQIIEAKNRATTIISDSLSKKEKDTLELLEDTKQQMTKMQNNFLNMELEWKKEKQDLVSQLEEKNEKIKNLEEANTILENSRFEISLAHSKLSEELESNKHIIQELEEKIQLLNVSNGNQDKSNVETEQEKGSLEITNMEELTKKMEWLEQINYQIRQTNKELESQLSTNSPEPKPSVKKGSPLPTRKGGRGSKLKSPWSQMSSETLNQDAEKKTKSDKSKSEILLQSLNKDILDKEYIISQKNEIISKLESLNSTKDVTICELKSQIGPEKQVINAIDVSTNTDVQDEPHQVPLVTEDSKAHVKDLEEKLLSAQNQIEALTNEIDIANKNMIKVKSSSKLKLKQLQKSIENFSKVSDSHAEIVKLNEQIHQLSQKVAELEEEKGNLQLHLVDYDSGRLTETEIYKKMVEMENLAEARLKSITLLETQKFDLVQELHNLQQKCVEMEDKLADMCQLQNEQVCSEMKSVELEEQIDELTSSKKELELIIENLKLDKEQLNNALKMLNEEKDELSHKLENYIQENMELTDKLEKLSAEKVSSAESIEIVESLTTQEKLELEEYNKSVESDTKVDAHLHHITITEEKEKLIEEAIELKKKIELFTQERQEVMDKMNKMCSDNNDLHKKLTELEEESDKLRENINILVDEKHKLQLINEELTQNIEDLKQEKLEVVKETVDVIKRPSIDENIDTSIGEPQTDDKSSNDKGMNRTKSMKQLTKEILKLKNTIKDRENEIADCQMKILSLEEQQEKQKELLQNLDSKESMMKRLTDENLQLKKEIDELKTSKESEQNILQLKHDNDKLQQDFQKIHHEYNSVINTRDSRIHELEQLLLEYEKQVINYVNSLQQKDKEMSEYINQITMLNDVSQKLKSTIDLLESEKIKDQNLERGLNKQISMQQKTLAEYEEKIRNLEKEKTQLVSVKNKLENKNNGMEHELKALQETLAERTARINDLEMQSKEFSLLMIQAKERDEEIHQIKLELRKESIENEKLRNLIEQKDLEIDELKKRFTEVKNQLNVITNVDVTKHEQYLAMENKNKELMEKLKKFAISLKKKSAMYSELEKRLNEAQEQLTQAQEQTTIKNQQLEQLYIQVEIIPALKEKLKYAEEEINQLQTKQKILENNYDEFHRIQVENKTLKESNDDKETHIMSLNERLDSLSKDLDKAREDNNTLKSSIDILNKKIVEYEVDQKNNSNLLTKISCLEAEVNKKQMQLTELSNVHDNHSEKLNQMQFSHEAKIQERDMYIESLQSEIEKYKSRIGRLEESISKMENSRLSLERKADQLDYQLQDKQKAYNDYVNQEDELVSRLAVLIDHDKVVEKQLQELENENKELKNKIQNFKEDLQRVNELYSEVQEKYHMYEIKANKCDVVEHELNDCQTKLRDMEIMLKRITNENQITVAQKNKDFENLELEFNTQIESAIKDKKILSEKYEKACEYSNKLEMELQQSRSTIDNLNSNFRDIVLENQKLLEESSIAKQSPCPDYTEQYIGEINKLQSIVNSKNEEIAEISNKIQLMHSNNLSKLSFVESQVIELDEKLRFSSTEISRLQEELSILKYDNDNLHKTLAQKEDHIKQLMENKKLVFEMTIPKTEGMTISSTIEALDTEGKPFDVSSIESQIVSDVDIHSRRTDSIQRKEEKKLKLPLQAGPTGEIIEPEIVSKKSYVCYKKDDDAEETPADPFNSDEGWGLESNIESDEVTPGMAYLHKQINILNETNQALKKDLDVSNTKLLKALKKLKELKSTNEMLTNELKLTKQLSQSSILDMAIESELSSNVEVLERKVQELNADLAKEKREKDALKKQNEVLNNANDRMIEMKEKMDNEVELWKYNFKQANDKLSSMQWGAEAKNSEHKGSFGEPVSAKTTSTGYEEELIKLEKENDELQVLIDNLTAQNKTLSTQVMQSKVEIDNLKQQLQDHLSKCEICDDLKTQLLELENRNKELQKSYTVSCENILLLESQYNQLKQDRDDLKCSLEECRVTYENKNSELVTKNHELIDEIQSLKQLQSESTTKLSSLYSELEFAKSELQNYNVGKNKDMDSMIMAEKYYSLQEINVNLEKSLDDANKNIDNLKLDNAKHLEKNTEYENKIEDLTKRINQLNSENDQLLSSVAELRASISSAVDQRGFEIAELWKQHLAQRENEFQTLEHDLRNQLNAFEVKYEQLLENVQSSSQEETNKIVITEQLTSLQTKLQEKEEHLLDLQNKYADAISQLDMLRSEIEDERLMLENKLLVQQEEYENVIKDLNSSHQQHLGDYENKNKILSAEVDALNLESINLNKRLEEMKQQYETETTELKRQLQQKESEIFQKTHDITVSLSQRNEEFETIRQQLIEYEKRIEELTFEKESELAMLRLKIHDHGETSAKIQKDLESERDTLSKALNEKIIECTNLNKLIADLNKELKEYADKAAETQMVLESQELEIVTLKDEISSLKDTLRLASSKVEKHVTFASDTKKNLEEESQSVLSKDLLDAVPKAELDLAMYMLHQRDVRCEELTMELTQLLEERDTLQLRLSDSLRSYEELRSQLSGANVDQFVNVSPAISELPTTSVATDRQFVDIHRGQTSRSSSVSDPDVEKPKLQAKLSELRSVKHSRDVVLRHDSEQRQLGLRLLHRDVANLPPEAIDQLTQAHHTLSRDSQSTSTVLLNWLRGKSTPKVVHM